MTSPLCVRVVPLDSTSQPAITTETHLLQPTDEAELQSQAEQGALSLVRAHAAALRCRCACSVGLTLPLCRLRCTTGRSSLLQSLKQSTWKSLTHTFAPSCGQPGRIISGNRYAPSASWWRSRACPCHSEQRYLHVQTCSWAA